MGKIRNPLRKAAKSSPSSAPSSLADRVEQKRQRLESTSSSSSSFQGQGQQGERRNKGEKEKKRSNKKGPADSSDDSSDSDEESGGNGGGVRLDRTISHERVEVTFEFSDVHARYEEGITLLLKWMLPSHEAYELASAICRQVEVGTAITCDGGEHAFAFASALPLAAHKDGPLGRFVAELSSALASAPPGCEELRDHLALGDAAATGVLLHSRFANLPLELIGPLLRNLDHDIEWAVGPEAATAPSSAEVGAQFRAMKSFLMIVPCTTPSELRKGSAVSILGSSSAAVLEYFEDDVFLQRASAAVAFRPADPFRPPVAVMLMPCAALKPCIQEVFALCPAAPV